MYLQKITLESDSDYPKNQLLDEFCWLLATYRKNGQIQGTLNNHFVSGDSINAFAYTLERDSLSKKYNNTHVAAQRHKVETLGNNPLKFELMGTELTELNPTCSCENSSSYTLSALYLSRESALYCNDCKCSIPLYRLPKFEHDDYEPILKWQLGTASVTCIETSNLDDESFPEISDDVVKALDDQAEAICEHIKKHIGIEVYILSSGCPKRNGKMDVNRLELAD
jgi:predicted  nucleic acid-binding Zn ribbon protein